MVKLFRAFIRKHLIATVPDAMDLCLTCRAAECSAAEYRACRPRVARAEALAAIRQAESTASASRTTASSAPGLKGETSPADSTSDWNGAAPPRPHSAT